MPTPCLNRCRLDDADRTCRDCGRTLDEIAAWGKLGFDEQRVIMAGLPARLAARRRAEAQQQQQQ